MHPLTTGREGKGLFILLMKGKGEVYGADLGQGRKREEKGLIGIRKERKGRKGKGGENMGRKEYEREDRDGNRRQGNGRVSKKAK